jgi:hypothetical protein
MESKGQKGAKDVGMQLMAVVMELTSVSEKVREMDFG